MTQADHIAEDVRLELHQLWMLPLILFRMICSFFQTEQAFLREQRKKGSTPKAWEDHILDLVEAEWAIAAIKAEGARRLLASEPIDFSTIRIPAPPDDWQPIVTDAADLMRRFEAIAGFHADPEKFIRRHAARISDPARDNIVRTPSWFDGRELRSLLTMRATTTSMPVALMVSSRRQAASVEPRGRGSRPVPHVHPP
jgi:hypothetical protein